MIKLQTNPNTRWYEFPNLSFVYVITQVDGVIHLIQEEDSVIMIALIPDYPPELLDMKADLTKAPKADYTRAREQLKEYKQLMEYNGKSRDVYCDNHFWS